MKIVVAGLVTILFALWIDDAVGWGELLTPWQTFPVVDLLVLVGVVGGSYVTRALRLYALYHHRIGGPFTRYLRLSTLHIALSNLLPMRSGEAGFPLLMKRTFGERYTQSVVNLVWIRIADLWFLIALGTAAIISFEPVWLAAIVAITLLGPYLVYPFRSRPDTHETRTNNRIVRLINTIAGGLPSQPSAYATVLLWTLITWLLKLGAFYVVVQTMIGGDVSGLIPGIAAAELSNALPIQGLAGLGSYEAAMLIGGQAASVDTTVLLQAAFNLHLFVIACTAMFGLAAWLSPEVRKLHPLTEPVSRP